MCHRDAAVAKYGLVNALFVFGRQFLEIVVPAREGTAAGRFLERSGGQGAYNQAAPIGKVLRRLLEEPPQSALELSPPWPPNP